MSPWAEAALLLALAAAGLAWRALRPRRALTPFEVWQSKERARR